MYNVNFEAVIVKFLQATNYSKRKQIYNISYK